MNFSKTMMRRTILMLSVVFFCALSCASGDTAAAKEAEYQFSYDFTIRNIPADAEEVNIWFPYPAENAHQQVRDESPRDAPDCAKQKDAVYGNNILHCSIRSPKQNSVRVKKTYRIKRSEFSNKPPASAAGPSAAGDLSDPEVIKYVKGDDFTSVNEEVRRLASELSKGKADTIEKARAFYDYLFENMTYDKAEPGWGQGDVARACAVKKGNCTDFHSFFIALCRSSGIAAKFVMGVSLPEKDRAPFGGYHCWAEFYDPRYGWIPVDISEAWKDKSKYEYHFGAVDERRVEFTHGRGIALLPVPKDTGEINYLIFPYAEIDGKSAPDVETSYVYKNISKN